MTVWLLLAALVGCSVDETGYLDTGDPASARGDDQPGAEVDISDSAPDSVYYTADAVLGAGPIDVTIVALPGTLPGAEVATLVVDEREGGVDVDVVDGGFVGVVQASLDDVVQVAVDGEPRLELALTHDLATPAGVAEALGETPIPPGAAAVDGFVDVGTAALEVTPPYLAFVVETVAGARVDEADVEVLLRADAGGTLCVAPLDSAGRAGTSACVVLP